MKLFHVLTKYKGEIVLPDALVKKLPSKILVSGTIQFKEQLAGVVKQLQSKGKSVVVFRGVHDDEQGQMLGCDIFTIGHDVDAFLYVGDGLFHPTAFLYDNVQMVYYYNPFSGKVQELTQHDIEKVKKRQKGSMLKFLSAQKIGVLVTTKPGQNNMDGAMELKKRLEKDGKKVFVFIEETLNIAGLENFPFIDCWVNTACPRIIEDSAVSMVNLWDLRNGVMKGFGVKVV